VTQPASVTTAADPILEVLRRSQADISAEQARILTDPTRRNRRERLRALAAMVDMEIEQIEKQAGTWIVSQIPAAYAEGMADSNFGVAFTQLNRQAAQLIVDDTFDDVLAATTNMRADTKRWVRETGKFLTEQGEVQGYSSKALTRRFVELGSKAAQVGGIPEPITAVAYKNGAKVGIDRYGEMLFRTKLGTAYNTGSVNRATEFGVTRFELFDGVDCGLRTHDDPEKANGMIVDAQTALAYPISHPNCRRSVGARPDLDADSPVNIVNPTTTPEQRADQAQFEAVSRARRSDSLSRSQAPSRSQRPSRSAT